MRTTKSLFLTLAAALFTTFAFAQFSSTLMENTGTAHNFATGLGTGEGANTAYTFAASATAGDGNGVCAVCHTPHNSQSTAYPLWDHDETATVFALYNGGVATGTVDGTADLTGSGSLLCLSCHDGSANLDSYGASLNGTAVAMDAADAYANFGSDLSDDHPIAILYPADAVAGSQQMNQGSTLASGFLYGTGDGTQTVECASCHSMHNPAVTSKLLRVTNDNSALCLTCHAK